MKKKQLKKIVVIGNGFDLAHGLKTSYKDFIDWIYCQMFKNIYNSFIERDIIFDEKKKYDLFDVTLPNFNKKLNVNNEQINRDIFEFLGNIKQYKNDRQINEDIINLIHTNYYLYQIRNISSFYKIDKRNSILFAVIGEYEKNKNWSDIEFLYLKLLQSEKIKNLNKDFNEIKEFLIKYLKTESKKEVKIRDDYRRFFNSVTSNDLVLNFNYTNTFNQYIGDKQCEIINIHGTLNDKMDDIIFGYGNYDFKEYEAIEESNDNEKLEYFKIFQYLNSDSYSKLFEFISDEEYEIVIIGHSCGLSDKSLLKKVFENEFCKKITFFYHQWENIETKDKEDNFKELTKNISRYFTDKSKMLGIVENKTKSYT